MWGVWSELQQIWFYVGGVVFSAEQRPIAEAQIVSLEHGREMAIMQAEQQAQKMRQKQSGIVTPGAMEVPGLGIVPLGGNRKSTTQAPAGNIVVHAPPDPRWKARRFEEWWKDVRAKEGKAVDLRG